MLLVSLMVPMYVSYESYMLLQSGKSYASESYVASQSSVCGSYVNFLGDSR